MWQSILKAYNRLHHFSRIGRSICTPDLSACVFCNNSNVKVFEDAVDVGQDLGRRERALRQPPKNLLADPSQHDVLIELAKAVVEDSG